MATEKTANEIRECIRNEVLAAHVPSTATAKTYTSLLYNHWLALDNRSLPAKAFLTENEQSLAVATSRENLNSRAALLSALWVLTGWVPYQQAMQDTNSVIKQQYKEQQPHDNPECTFENIQDLHGHYMHQFNTRPNMATAYDALLSGLTSGVYEGTPPRRLMDYTELKWVDYDPEKDNFIEPGLGYMWFNQYKTARFAKDGPDCLAFPEQLRPAMILVLNYNAQHNLPFVFNTRNGKYINSTLCKRLHKLFGFSVDKLRSAFLTNYHKGTPAIKDMEQLAEDMGHSVHSQMLFYVKKEAKAPPLLDHPIDQG